jgi:tankyrase
MKYPLFECLGNDYPFALEAQYERILKKIDELWGTDEIDVYFTDLIIDNRGGRKGFPADVLNDILRLRDFSESERLRQAETPQEAVEAIKGRGITFNDQEFLKAIQRGEQEVVDLFVRGGMSVHIEDEQGTPAIILALKKGFTVVARILLGAGADPNARDKMGFTPLLLACGKPTFGYKAIAERLIHKGADINVRDRLGWTPLLLSLSGGTLGIAEILIERGADISARTRAGESALALAKKAGHEHIVRLLEAKGARP